MDSIMDIAGPLGTPTPIEKKGTIICVGGGTGVAVLAPHHPGLPRGGQQGHRHHRGAHQGPVDHGRQDAGKATDELYVCTDDGSYGHHGFVTDVLREQLTKLGSEVKEAVCIGPVPMMKFCCARSPRSSGCPPWSASTPSWSTARACAAAAGCSVGGETKFACVDGPEFDGHKVDFDGLSQALDRLHAAGKRGHGPL